LAGVLAAQPQLTVIVSGTLGPYLSGSGEVTTPGTYVSGITATGTSSTQYCVITYSGNSGGTPAQAKIYLGPTFNPTTPVEIPQETIGSNALENPGSGYSYSSPPTTATVANGTATNCTGTAMLLQGSVKIDDSLGLNGGSFTATNTLNPVGVAYNATTNQYTNLPITFSAGGFDLTCNATVTVTLNDATDLNNDTLKVTGCVFKAGDTAFNSTVAFPVGTIPAAVPMAFSSSLLDSPTSVSEGTYTPGASSTFNGDVTTLGISGTISVACGTGANACSMETLAPTTLPFTATVGSSAPPTQTVTVNTSPQVNESFAVTTSASWLTANPAGGVTGTTGGQINVGVNPTGLAPNTYTGYVCVYSAASNSTASPCSGAASTPFVTVTLTVTPEAVTLVPAPTSFTFNSVNSTAVQSQSLSVTTSPSTSESFTATPSTTSGGNWLSVSSSTGTTGGAAIMVMADPTKVTGGPGTYSGMITLAASGAPNVQVPVTFNVTTVSTSTALNFSGVANGSNPPNQQFIVTATGNVDISFGASASTTSGGQWLSVTGSGTTNVTELTVSVNIAGLAANTYNGSISITPPGGTPIQVATVTLVVSNLPTMQVATGTSLPLAFAYTPGSTPSLPLVIVSSSSTAINYTVSTNVSSSGGNWLQALPTPSSTGATETVSVVTSVASTLANGSYSGNVVFTCSPTTSCGNASGQLSVPVTLTVTATLRRRPPR
jgi:hypothetical protein